MEVGPSGPLFMIYIEKFWYEDNFDVKSFFSSFEAGRDYEPSWPAVLVSSSRANFGAHEAMMNNYRSGKPRTRPSLCLAGGLESVHTQIVSTLGLRNMTFSVLSACTSSAYALYQAGLISQQQGTPVIVACADMFSPIDMHWFDSLGAVSPETGIPFDKNSKGFRPSKAQAMFVVSSKPIAAVAAVEQMFFLTQSQEKTAVGSLDEIATMFDTVAMNNVDWWNAHAPGTPLGDKSEFELFSRFKRDIPISSLKGKYGHALASSYLLELGGALTNVIRGWVPANEGITEKIVEDDRIITSGISIGWRKRFVKFNMGFGGKNVLSVIKVLV